MITWAAKDPDEVVAYQIDWTAILVVDQIDTYELEVTAGSAVIDSTALDTANRVISATISGGESDETCTFLCTIITVGGDIREETITLNVVDSSTETEPSSTRKRAIIEMAAEECRLAGYEFNFSPEEQMSSLRKLDALCARWKREGIDLGYNFPAILGEGELDDPSGVNDADVETLALELAMRISPMVGKALSGTTLRAHREAVNGLRVAHLVIPDRQLSPGTPLGAGHKARLVGTFAQVEDE